MQKFDGEVEAMAFYAKSFGTILRNARMDKKLTQAELAEILDIREK